MKKLLLAFFTLAILTGCGRDDEPQTQPEKQDFTNANFIKQTLQGDWKGTFSSNNGISWTSLEGQYNVGYKTTYNFSSDSYTFRPFTTDQYAVNTVGTYTVIPVTGNNNAVVILSYKGNNSTVTKPLTLIDYKDNVVTFVEPDNGFPEKVRYYKFQKQ